MEMRELKKRSLFAAISLLIFLSACVEYKDPATINTPPGSTSAGAVISNILPADSAMAGVREITIVGENFATNGTDTNWIYIGGRSPIVKSVAHDKIVVYRPSNDGDSLVITVADPKSMTRSFHRYSIERPIGAFGDFTRISRDFYVMELDKQGNVWIDANRYLYKISPDGLYQTVFLSDSLLGSAFTQFTDMKFGPGGYLFFELGNRRTICRVNPASPAKPDTFVVLSSTVGNVSKFDFDQNGNIYTGKSTGLYFVAANKTVTATGHYTNGFTFVEIRVIGSSLYVADTKRLLRNVINTGGSLGSDDPLVDLNTIPELSDCDITSFNVDGNGAVILSLKNHPKYSLFALEGNGSVSPYYADNILPSGVDQIIWGNDRHIYLNRSYSLKRDTTGSGNYRLYRMGMVGNGSAYWGRTLP